MSVLNALLGLRLKLIKSIGHISAGSHF